MATPNKPSAILAEIIDICPETNEPQGILTFGATPDGKAMVLITRGESTAWRHTITIEEADPINQTTT